MKPVKFEQEVMDALPSCDALTPAFKTQCALANVNDAAETIVFARQLESLAQRSYTIQYPTLRARDFIPTLSSANPADEYLTYNVWDSYPMAKITSNYDTSIPTVGVSAREITVKPYMVATSWKVSVDDMRASNRAGKQLDTRLAEVGRRSIEIAREEAAFKGVPQLGTFGLANHPNVSLISLTNGSWSTATGEQILADMNQLVTTLMTNTNQLFNPNTMLLSDGSYRIVATKLLNTANSSNITVLEAFRAQNPGFVVDRWSRLGLADASGTKSRIIVYRNDPSVLAFEVATEWETMPVEYHAMTWTTVARAKYYGVQLFIPTAVAYADNNNVVG